MYVAWLVVWEDGHDGYTVKDVEIKRKELDTVPVNRGFQKLLFLACNEVCFCLPWIVHLFSLSSLLL